MYPHLDTALALSRSEQASLASINKELLQRNAKLLSRIRDLDEIIISRDKTLDTNTRSSSQTISTLRQNVSTLEQRLTKHQQRGKSRDETIALLENRLQSTQRERVQFENERDALNNQISLLRKKHQDCIININTKHKEEITRTEEELKSEVLRIREQWLVDQKVAAQVLIERQNLELKVMSLETERDTRKTYMFETQELLESTKDELANYIKTLDSKKQELSKALSINDLKTSEILALTREKDKLEHQYESLKDTCAHQKEKILQSDIVIQNLQTELSHHKQDNVLLKRDLENEVKIKNELLLKNSEFKFKNEKNEETIKHLEKTNINLEDDNKCILLDYKSLQNEYKLIQTDLHHLESFYEQAKIDISKVEDKLLNSEIENKRFHEDISDRNSKISELYEKIKDLQVSVQVSENRENDLKTELELQKEHYNEQLLHSQHISLIAQQDVEVLREKLGLSKQTLFELRHKLQHAQSELNVAIGNNSVGVGVDVNTSMIKTGTHSQLTSPQTTTSMRYRDRERERTRERHNGRTDSKSREREHVRDKYYETAEKEREREREDRERERQREREERERERKKREEKYRRISQSIKSDHRVETYNSSTHSPAVQESDSIKSGIYSSYSTRSSLTPFRELYDAKYHTTDLDSDRSLSKLTSDLKTLNMSPSVDTNRDRDRNSEHNGSFKNRHYDHDISRSDTELDTTIHHSTPMKLQY